MQILASALPGFRELRALLIAGYLWLLFLWILIKPDLHNRPSNVVAGAVYDLGEDAGPFWVGLGVGVAAYLIGSVSQALSPVIGHKALPALGVKVESRLRSLRYPGVTITRVARHPDLIRKYADEASRKVPLGWPSQKPGIFRANPAHAEVRKHVEAARRGLDAELELPATLLLGKEPDEQLFSEADRLKAERELRLAVVPPLCAIAIFLGLNQSCWWWFALIPVAVLLWQGHSRNLEFRSLMVGTVERGLARSRSIDELKGWVEALPEPSSEQKADEGTALKAPDSDVSKSSTNR